MFLPLQSRQFYDFGVGSYKGHTCHLGREARAWHTTVEWHGRESLTRGNRWTVFVVGLLLAGMLPLTSASGIAGAGTHKVLVDRADGATLTMLAQSGARLLVNYDAFVLWEVPDTKIQTVAGRASVQQRDHFNDIYVRTGKITAPSSVPPVPANLRQSKASSGYQLWMVQFVGPIKGDWLENLHKLGIEAVIYMPNNAYVVWVDGAGLKQLQALVGKDPTVQWTGAYEPAYRLEPSLQTLTGAQPVAVTIQFYRTANTPASLASVQALGGTVLKPAEEILNFTNITLEVPASELVNLANRADVFKVEPFVPPQRRDEVQDQIVAGNITTSGGNVVPSGTGYLAWLALKEFPTDPAQYPIVDIVDDGIDDGSTNPLHPDFHQLGVAANPSRLIFNSNCTANPAADGLDGHGNINAGIVGSYNNLAGFPYQDANNYRIGLGVSPYTRIAGTKIFDNNGGAYDVGACGGTDSGIVANAYNNGATFTSNSWGADTNGAYNSADQAYDSLTRDASATTAGNQQMLHVFAAGNAGSGAQTVGSPGSAKNVLTVGATENVRENGVVSGCSYNGAASADNIAPFSSRGPAADGRVKPEIMAPGVHIQGPASQDPGYNGSGVCNQYHPAGQTLYTWSTGTSHSTPATAGAASLVYNYYGRVLNPGQTPSPAMLKALLLNTPRYLNGTGTGGTLPSNNQGWGDVNLGALFDGTTRNLTDQSYTFTTTGQTFFRSGAVADSTKPVRVTLVWTDAPGSTSGNAYVNDLNLEVTVGGNTYKGNVFSGANSITGGVADAKNNVENVFLPAGVSGAITVKVTAANLAAAAVPGGPGTVNQDFALVVSDGTITGGAAPNLSIQPVTFSDAAPGGNNNGAIDPGETIALTVPLTNGGDATATGVSGTLTTTTGTVTIANGTSAYPDIAPAATASNTTALRFQVSASQVCGAPLNFSFTATYNSGLMVTTTFSLPTGTPTLGASQSYRSTDVPKAIPDNNPAGVISTLPVATTGAVGKVVVHLDVTHTYDSDLVFTLIAPDSTTVTLIDNRGGGGHNFTGTVLDDSATTAISAGSAPFTGFYKPEQPLAALDGKAINGTWQLKVADFFPVDTGTLNNWSLDIRPTTPVCRPLGPTTISGIAITPPSGVGNPPSVKVGQIAQFTATGTYTDGSTQNLTTQVQWRSSNPAIAQVDVTGKVTGESPGTATITATLSGVTQTIAVTVAEPTPIGIAPAPAPQGRPATGSNIPIGASTPVSAPAPRP